MAASINGNNISLTRGDTLKLTVTIMQDGDIYDVKEGDRIRFALKKNIADTECLIIKEIPNNTKLLHLVPSDTKQLPFGVYVYDIELTTENGDVDTFIGPAKFTLTDEVY